MDTSRIIKGDDLMVFLNDKSIAFATNHTISLNSNLTEITCKDGNGWSTGIAGSKSWEATSENLYCSALSGDNKDNTAYNMLPLFINSTPIDLKFTIKNTSTPTTSPSTAYFTPNTNIYNSQMLSGQAIITSFNINANSGDNATMSVTFKGITPIKISFPTV